IPEVKLIENIAGLVSGGMFTISAFLRSQKEKDYRAIAEANHAIVKEGLKGDFTYEQSRQQITAKRRLAADIKQLFERGDASADECYRWIQEYGLHGLIELPQIQHPVIEKTEQRPALKGVFNPNQSTFEQISDDLVVPVDYSWMDAKFINASKAVFGSK
ncbi:MAG: hypothetical protein ACKPFA_00565, partial [Dolichospermum sp.]